MIKYVITTETNCFDSKEIARIFDLLREKKIEKLPDDIEVGQRECITTRIEEGDVQLIFFQKSDNKEGFFIIQYATVYGSAEYRLSPFSYYYE